MQRILAAVSLLVVVVFYACLYRLLPTFGALFREAALPVPGFTQLVLDTYLYWFVFLLFGIAGFALIWWRRRPFGWYLLLAAVLSVAILLPITVGAMYGPLAG